MPKSMRALQIMAPGDAKTVTVEIPKSPPGEVLVRVEAVTVCKHWDTTMLAGTDIFERPGYPKYPIDAGKPGHEMAGEVVATGEDIETLSVGDRVAAWNSVGSARPDRLGYYAEFASVPEEDLLRIPDHLSYHEAAPLELAMCVAASVRQAGDVAGKRVAVGGAGPAGLIAIQMVKALGARRVDIFDPVKDRRELALSLGVNRAIAPDSDESQKLGNRSYDLAIECAGAAQSAENLMRVTSGPVHLFGVVHGEIRFKMDHWGRNVQLMGYPGHTLPSAELALSMMVSGALKTDPLIGVKVGFEDYLDGIEALKDSKVAKVCILPQKGV